MCWVPLSSIIITYVSKLQSGKKTWTIWLEGEYQSQSRIFPKLESPYFCFCWEFTLEGPCETTPLYSDVSKAYLINHGGPLSLSYFIHRMAFLSHFIQDLGNWMKIQQSAYQFMNNKILSSTVYITEHYYFIWWKDSSWKNRRQICHKITRSCQQSSSPAFLRTMHSTLLSNLCWFCQMNQLTEHVVNLACAYAGF